MAPETTGSAGQDRITTTAALHGWPCTNADHLGLCSDDHVHADHIVATAAPLTTTERNRQMTTTDRPENNNIANREYYANMPTRRARVTVEVDVEWREDDPDYSFSVLRDGELDSIRVRNMEVKTTEWVDG